MSEDRNIDNDQDVEGHSLFGEQGRKDLFSGDKNDLANVDSRRVDDDDVEGHSLLAGEGRKDLFPDGKNSLDPADN